MTERRSDVIAGAVESATRRQSDMHEENRARHQHLIDCYADLSKRMIAHSAEDIRQFELLTERLQVIDDKIDQMRQEVVVLFAQSVGRGAWSIAKAMRRVVIWGGPFAAIGGAIYGWLVGKWPFSS